MCSDIDPEDRVKRLFDDCVAPLHHIGARNFLIFDNPPRKRSSMKSTPSATYVQHYDKIKIWNETLWRLAEKVEKDHADTSVFVFPTWDLFTSIFDDPAKYGFRPQDVVEPYGGKMWMDVLHPTSAVHKIIADHVVELLS